MGRPRSQDPKTVVSARVSSKQLALLKRYAEIKGLSESEAICRMIDGAEAFVSKHDSTQATVSAADTSHQAEPEHHIEETDDVAEEEGDSGLKPVSSINGRLVVGLPGAHFDEDEDDNLKFSSIAADE